ncbi:MAG: substrate-binding domain-containing protein [Hyphomicrobiales bacterium]|nr:substrate-binding domain-containing protein [Hyphomicrobiales bacterium]
MTLSIRPLSLGALAVAAMLGLPASAQARDIKVCLIAGKTGALEAYAKQTEVGFMMGLEFLTKGTNTVGADKIEVIVKDDQLKPDRGKALLEECYGDDKADIAVGTTGSPVALAMLPVAEERKKVLIVEPAVADSITGDKWNRYIFRTGRSSYQDALAAAASIPDGDAAIGMLGLDTAFGRDGVKAFKEALASVRPKAKVVAEEYAAGNTADFTPFAERLFNALKDQPGKRIIGFIWAGAHPMAKFVDMKPERFNITLAPGGNILPVMNSWKQFAGAEGGIYYYYDFPKNPMNDWLKAEYQKRHNAPPDFFVAGGFAAASAVVAALQKTGGSTDTEKLIAAMEGMSFDTPKGLMTFRKEDHQALQDMYAWRIKKDAKDNDVLELVATIPAKDMPLPIRVPR